jgi:hypothetical protein
MDFPAFSTAWQSRCTHSPAEIPFVKTVNAKLVDQEATMGEELADQHDKTRWNSSM